jgi:SAM-dependent methyltransferase
MATEERYTMCASYRWMEIVTGTGFIGEVFSVLGVPRSVADVGGGCGQWAHYAQSYGAMISVVEREVALVELGQQMHRRFATGVQFLCNDLGDLETDEQYEAVVSIQGLWSELIHRRWEVLDGVARLLAPNGHAVLVDVGDDEWLDEFERECHRRDLFLRATGLAGGQARDDEYDCKVGVVLRKQSPGQRAIKFREAFERAVEQWPAFSEFANQQSDWRCRNTAAYHSVTGASNVVWFR